MIRSAVALTIPDGIRRSMRILATHRALFGHVSTASGVHRLVTEAEVIRVVEVLEALQIRWALIGGQAMNLLVEPRITSDFDFVIESGHLDAVLRELTAAFGQLDEVHTGTVTRLSSLCVDLIASSVHPSLQAALDRQRVIEQWNVPHTEVLVVLRFMSSMSSWRDSRKRRQDVADIVAICEQPGINLDRAAMLGLARSVNPGAVRALENLLDAIERDEPISI